MARTERNVVSYFPHDAEASKGDTLTILQSRYGNDGYAVWFKLLEKLSATDGHYVDCRNPLKWKLFLVYLGTDEITTVEILNLLVELECLDPELWGSGIIWCQKLVDNVSDVYKNRKREKPSKPIIACNNPVTTTNNALTTPGNTQIKEKEIKENKSSSYRDPKFNEYVLKLANRFPGLNIEECWDDCQAWYQRNGRVMKDAQQTLLNWCKKEAGYPNKRAPAASRPGALPTSEQIRKEFNSG